MLEFRALTAAQFQGLSEVPPEPEWFANIPNEKTRRAYQLDITDFSAFVGIHLPEEFRFPGIRREELCKLRVRGYQRRDGIMHFRIEGKGEKVRFISVATEAQRLIHAYLETSEHGRDLEGPLFRPEEPRDRRAPQAAQPPIRL